MNEQKLNRMLAGIDPWKENFGTGMERRGADGQSWYDLSVNGNTIPCDAHTAIIVTSWMGQLKWLKAVLAQYRQVPGAFVILAYDNPFYAWAKKDMTMLRCMPNPEHYCLANAVVHKHITYDSDKRNGWFWDVIYAKGIINSFPNLKHVYVTNGDCIIEKPEGFKDVIELLGDADLISGQHTPNGVIHTATMLFKREAFFKVFDYMYELMRVPVVGSRSPEGMVIEAVAKLGIKVKVAPKQPLDPKDGTVDCYACHGQESTWRELLGFRNLFAEQETSWNIGREPLPAKYIDGFGDWIYFGGEERETICKYWETGDRRYLMQWWDIGEDSWYNRLYYPLTHYGKDPIYAPKDEAAGT